MILSARKDTVILLCALFAAPAFADKPQPRQFANNPGQAEIANHEPNAATQQPNAAKRPQCLIGYSEYRTNLPGGRWVNMATMRAYVVRADGTGRKPIGESLVNEPFVRTQFVGWSPDGKIATLLRAWEDPNNGQWEQEHRTWRFEPGKWLVDSYLLDMATGTLTNVTGVERVSVRNIGVSYLPGSSKLYFTPLIGSEMRPYLMDRDGRNKQDVSGKKVGYAYGSSASPDGKFLSYHENYQIYISDVNGQNKSRIETGNPFNSGPTWSPDGQWLLFLSGKRGQSNHYIVRRDGSGLRKLADVNGYQGVMLFLDVNDFHGGLSDVPAWGKDGRWVYFTAQTGPGTTEIMRVNLDGERQQLTHSKEGVLNYQPEPSPDGKWICFGSNRTGTRQLYVMSVDGKDIYPITDVSAGWGAILPQWQPTATEIKESK
jgi:TolB protein